MKRLSNWIVFEWFLIIIGFFPIAVYAVDGDDLNEALGLEKKMVIETPGYDYANANILPEIGNRKPIDGTFFVGFLGNHEAATRVYRFLPLRREFYTMTMDYIVFHRIINSSENMADILFFKASGGRIYPSEDPIMFLWDKSDLIYSIKCSVDELNVIDKYLFCRDNDSIYYDIHKNPLYWATPEIAGGTGFENPKFPNDPKDRPGLTSEWKTVTVSDIDRTIGFEIYMTGHTDDVAVYVGNFQFTQLGIIDPNPELISGTGEIQRDGAAVAVSNKTVEGVATDGVTKVIVRYLTPSKEKTVLCLDAAEGSTAITHGGLMQFGSKEISAGSQCVNMTFVPMDSGWMGLAIYQSPTEGTLFINDPDGDHKVTFVLNQEGIPEPQKISLNLVRPPTLLVHGIWSNGANWYQFPLYKDEEQRKKFRLNILDYKNTNADAFSNNFLLVRGGINRTLEAVRQEKIAVTQVNIVAHSMGGILSRLHIGRGSYKNKSNFRSGDVHKLITVDTPHFGSPWATCTQNLYELLSPWYCPLNDTILTIPGFSDLASISLPDMPIDCNLKTGHHCANYDLARLYSGLIQLPATSVPSYALVGIGGTAETAKDLLISPAWGGLVNNLAVLIYMVGIDPTVIFEGELNDVIVGWRSQTGDIPSSAYSTFDAPHGLHTYNPRSALYSEKIRELLDLDVTDPQFSQFPETPLATSSIATNIQGSVPAIRTTNNTQDELVITSPVNDSTVTSGQAIQISVQPNPEVTVDRMVLLGPDVLSDDTPPFEFQVVVPQEAVGPIKWTALGKNSNNIFTSPPITLNASPTATLQSIEVQSSQDVIFSSIGETLDLRIIGHYSDGVDRDLTASDTGTTYDSANPEWVTVSPEGVLTAQAEGSTYITARNQEVSTFITTRLTRDSYALSVSKTGSGTVISTPAGIDCGETCVALLKEDTNVTLTATPASDSTFTGWSGNCAGIASTCTVAMNAAQGVTATFNTAAPDPNGLLTLSGDYNGDGKADVIWHNGTTGQAYGMLLDSATIGQQGLFYQEPNTAWRIVHNGDFDGNGQDDLLWWNSQTGQIYEMPMNGLDIAGGALIYQEPNTAWQIVAVGDLNGDGKADLIWWNNTTGHVYGMLMNGVAIGSQGMLYQESNTAWQILAARDFTGDHKADLLWRNATTGQVYLMLMDGLAIAGGAMLYQESNLAWSIVATGDLNGDGKTDLIWWNSQTGQVYEMLMDGATISAQGMIYYEPNTAWRIVASGDYTGDGQADLLWRNSTTGQIYQMAMQGLTVAGGAIIYQEANSDWRIAARAEATPHLPPPDKSRSDALPFAPLSGEPLNPHHLFDGEPVNAHQALNGKPLNSGFLPTP
ncbi:MAG: FG-GAP repeat protein [Gammaproteobacteria bacterium]|nr:FG-GAP repeat protein [Gammaproteobacteria bacterium]MCP5196527.1 FG-GAP repeat protein [Gammaproteobacteria bacterium]